MEETGYMNVFVISNLVPHELDKEDPNDYFSYTIEEVRAICGLGNCRNPPSLLWPMHGLHIVVGEQVNELYGKSCIEVFPLATNVPHGLWAYFSYMYLVVWYGYKFLALQEVGMKYIHYLRHFFPVLGDRIGMLNRVVNGEFTLVGIQLMMNLCLLATFENAPWAWGRLLPADNQDSSNVDVIHWSDVDEKCSLVSYTKVNNLTIIINVHPGRRYELCVNSMTNNIVGSAPRHMMGREVGGSRRWCRESITVMLWNVNGLLKYGYLAMARAMVEMYDPNFMVITNVRLNDQEMTTARQMFAGYNPYEFEEFNTTREVSVFTKLATNQIKKQEALNRSMQFVIRA